MSASRVRRIPVAIVFCLSLFVGLAPPAAGADPQPLKPTSMAATGDSITRAFNLCFFPFTDCLARSWSTGNNSTVNSHARRLVITGSAFNDAVSGAKMANLPTQMTTVSNRNVGYVTVLMGGNDVCTDTETLMTVPASYEANFRTAMNTLAADSTLVYVVSVPNVKVLWEVLKDNTSARSAWNSYNICQSLLANPLSTAQADVDRRERVKQRNMELNQRLRAACSDYQFCRFDGEAAFGTDFVPNDVSTRDYFHPSTAGQAKLASVSWDHGYWGPTDTNLQMKEPNATPTPTFTNPCTDLTCTFTASSTEADVTFSWHFGDLSTSVEQAETHTFAVAGTYEVTLHAIDTFGATASVTKQVTVPGDGGGTEPETGMVAGTVTASAGGAIAGATVTIAGTDLTDTADSAGAYSIASVPAGERTVTASAEGYQTQSTSAMVTSGGTTVNFALSASGGSEPATMHVADLSGVAQLKGKSGKWEVFVTVTVHDVASNPVGGATVTGAWSGSASGTPSGTTAGDGTVTFATGTLSGGTSVTYTMVDVVLTGFTYDEESNVGSEVTVTR